MRSIWRIIQIAKPFHKLLIGLSFIILVSSLIDISGTVVIKFVIDELQRQIVSGTGNLNAAFWLLGLMFGLNIITVPSNILGA